MTSSTQATKFRSGATIALQFLLLFGIPIAVAFLPVPPQLQKWLAVLILLGVTFLFYRKNQISSAELGLSSRLFGRYFPAGLAWGIAVFCVPLLAQSWFNKISIL